MARSAPRRRSAAEQQLALQITQAGLLEPDIEYRFDPIRRWRFDFAWPSRLLACEVEGGIWTRGRHTRGAGFEADCFKYSQAALAGWCVIRVTPAMINSGDALDMIRQGLAKRAVS